MLTRTTSGSELPEQHQMWDLNEAINWTSLLHGNSPGLVNVCAFGDWAGCTLDLRADDGTGHLRRYIEEAHFTGRQGIYLRATTLRTNWSGAGRGNAEDSISLPGLWADIDIAGPGHKHDPAKYDGRELPCDENVARNIITSSGLPEPTLWVHSGGGLYPWWLFNEPMVFHADDDRRLAAAMSQTWQEIIEDAARNMGLHYGAGVGDLTRVLRIPGTANRKAGLQRPCRVIEDDGALHEARDLASLASRWAMPKTSTTIALASPPKPPAPRDSDAGMRPGEDYIRRGTWQELLEPQGWTLTSMHNGVGQWVRPGKDPRDGISATSNYLGTGRLHVFSEEAAPLQAGKSYDLLGAYAALFHNNSIGLAVADLGRQGYGAPVRHDDLRDLIAPDKDIIADKDIIDGALVDPEPDGRDALDVTHPALAVEWLREALGRGKLSGMFRRREQVVYTTREGENGYRPARGPGDDDGPFQVRALGKSELASQLQMLLSCYATSRTGARIPAMFPVDAARVVVDSANEFPGLRILTGVIHAPIVRSDGSLLEAPGFDAATGLLYLPTEGLDIPAVPETPTDADVRIAVDFLHMIASGFVFVSDGDRANFFGAMLTPLLRELCPPPYKLVAVGAPQPGSGKTLLANVLRTLHGGVLRLEIPGDDAEFSKQITAILDTTTGPVVVFDNVTGVLKSSVLAGLLTTVTWDDRRLGSTAMVHAINDRLWVVTGNNVSLGGDLQRRTMWITIDAGIPHPELRQDFAIPDLIGWVEANRSAILYALLVLVRRWVASGKPRPARGADSFGAWSSTIAGILGCAGIVGEFDSQEAVRQQAGEEDGVWGELLAAICASFGEQSWTVKEMLARVDTGLTLMPNGNIPLDALPEQLVDKFSRSGNLSTISRSMGRWLANRDGRWADGRCVRKVGMVNHVAQWKVVVFED